MTYIIFTLLHNLLDFQQVNLFKRAKHWDSFFTHCTYIDSTTSDSMPLTLFMIKEWARAMVTCHMLNYHLSWCYAPALSLCHMLIFFSVLPLCVLPVRFSV